MSRFVFLPVDSECDQLVKQRDTECGSGGGGGGDGGGGGAPISFTVRVCGQALSKSRMKEKKWGRVQHNEHNDKQKNFSVICGRFPLTPPPNSVRQLGAKKGSNKEKKRIYANLFKLSSLIISKRHDDF